MQNEKPKQSTRRRTLTRNAVAGLLTLVMTLASTGLVAFGAFHNNGRDGLAEVGPIASNHPFPVWYRDTTGKRLELCLDVDTFCLLTSADLPRPGEPIDVGDGLGGGNFPPEAFWFAADSIFPADSGKDASLVLALEAAFLNGPGAPIVGTQVIFGRVRIRITGLQANGSYKITHPYGTDTVVATGGEINTTEDIGLDQTGVGALSSRIGPFLTAVNPPPPAGYVGDPNVEQTVTGSPYSTNFFRIEGPGIGTNPSYPCVGAPAPADPANCIQHNGFVLAGKYATNGGVQVDAVRYSRDTNGNTTLNVYARSESDQAIQVDGPSFYVTNAVSTAGSYYARVTMPGQAAPERVTVTNKSDNPPTVQTADPVDMVTITRAEFDTNTGVLTVEAASSDEFTNPALTLEGFNLPLTGGSLALSNMNAAPLSVTVHSAKGGTDTQQVQVIGPGHSPLAVQANAGPIQSVTGGAPVALNGTGSAGEITAFSWAQVSNGAPSVALNNANSAIATFTAPSNTTNAPLTLTFALTVQGPGGPSTSTVNVVVRAGNVPPVANAGADQTVMRSSIATVDAGASTNALTYIWSQVSGPAVTLSGANTARASFTFPYTANPGTPTPVVLRVTATGPGGSATDDVTITPLVDDVIITSAQYTRSSGEWRVRGTDNLIGLNNQVAIYRGLTCPVGGGTNTSLIARVAVDALGAWEFRGTAGAPDASNRVSVCTTGGDRQLSFQLRIR